MARWLVIVGLLAARPAAAQPPATTPPPPPAAAPPSAVAPLTPQKPPDWPREIGGKNIAFYVGELTSPDPTVREQAVKTLPYFGPMAARPFSGKLVLALRDDDPGVRVNAILALAGIGFESKADLHKAAQSLREAVRNTSSGSVIRLYAARCLGMMGTEAYEALDAVVVLAKDPAWETRDAAAAALGRVGAAVYDPTPVSPGSPPPQPKRGVSPTARAKLLDLLKDPSKAVRLEAIQSLLLLGPPTTRDPDLYAKEVQPAIDEVNKRLAPGTDKAPGEKDASVRLWLHTLLLMYDDRQATAAVKELTAALNAPDKAVRLQGLTALTVCGSLAAKALDEVRQALFVSEPEVAMAAIMCILRMGTEGRKAVGDLQRLAASATDPEVKKMAAEAARLLSPGAAPAK